MSESDSDKLLKLADEIEKIVAVVPYIVLRDEVTPADLRRIADELEKAQSDLATSQKAFDAIWQLNLAAVYRWQKANPDKSHGVGDQIDLVTWLIGSREEMQSGAIYDWDKISKLQKERDELKAAVHSLTVTGCNIRDMKQSEIDELKAAILAVEVKYFDGCPFCRAPMYFTDDGEHKPDCIWTRLSESATPIKGKS